MVCIQHSANKSTSNTKKAPTTHVSAATGDEKPRAQEHAAPNASTMDIDGDGDRLQLQHLAGGDIVSHRPLYSPNGELLFVISKCVVQIFSTTTGELTRQLTGATSNLVAMEFELKNDQILVTCTENGDIIRWKWQTGLLESTIHINVPAGQVHTFNLLNIYGNWDTACAFVTHKPNGGLMQWCVLNTSNGMKMNIPCNLKLCNKKPLVAVDTKNFKTIVIAQAQFVYFIDYSSWKWMRLKNAHEVPVTVVCVHPKEDVVATGDETGRIFLWRQFMDNKTVRTSLYHWHHTSVTSISFSASGSSFFSSGLESVLVKWNVGRPEMRDFIPRMTSIILHITTSEINNEIAVSTADNGVQIIGTENRIKCTLQEFTYIMDDKTGKEKFPIGLRMDPRTNTLVLNGRMGHLQFYSAYTKSLLYNMDIVVQNQLSMESEKILYNIRVTKAAFNIDWMATGEVYNDEEHLPELRLKFWQFQKESQNYTLNTNIELPHEGGFKAIEFSNDYQVDNLLCATVGEDNKIKIWSLEESNNIYKKGKVWYCIAQTSYKSMPVESVSFSQDGSLLAAGFGNTLCIYKSDNLKLKAALTGAAGHEGFVQKAQVCVAKQNVNGSKNELAEQRKKVMRLFTNLLETNDESLIKEIQKSINANRKESSPMLTLEDLDDKQKQQLFNKISNMNELNLFQKVLLFQKLKIYCDVHPQWQQTMASYLRQTVVESSIKEKYTKLHSQVQRLNPRDRYKAKHRLARFATRKCIYDEEITKNLVPILSVMNLKDTAKGPTANGTPAKKKKKSKEPLTTPFDTTKKIVPPGQPRAEISHVQFAAGDCAHLVIACTEHRVLIWNLLTLRLQSVLKLSVDHIRLDPMTNLIAAFTKNGDLHVFQPNVPLPIYQRHNLPKIHGSIWLPRRYPKPRSINLDWQAQSTLYFLTDSQEIMYLGATDDAPNHAPPPVSLKSNGPELRYSTFGTFATQQISEKTPLRQTGPLVLPGKTAVKSLIEMATHTMPPLSLICGEFVKTLVKPAESSSKTSKANASNGDSSRFNGDNDVEMNGIHSDQEDDEDDDDDSDETKKKSEIRKFLMVKTQEIRKQLATPSTQTGSSGPEKETQLRLVAEQTIDLEF